MAMIHSGRRLLWTSRDSKKRVERAETRSASQDWKDSDPAPWRFGPNEYYAEEGEADENTYNAFDGVLCDDQEIFHVRPPVCECEPNF